MVGPKVSGGIIDNIAAQGSLRFFKINTVARNYFANTTSDGTIIIPGALSGDRDNPDYLVPTGQPVPGSVADRVFRTIMENCNVVLISVIGDNDIHFICENEGMVWGEPALGGGAAGPGANAAAGMQAAVRALGTIGSGAAGSLDSPIPDATNNGATAVDLNVGDVTIVEVDFDIVV